MAEPATNSNRAADRGCVNEGVINQGERPVPIDGGFQGCADRRSDVVLVRSGRVRGAGGCYDAASRDLHATAASASYRSVDAGAGPTLICSAYAGGSACAPTIIVVVFGEVAVAHDPAGRDANRRSGVAHHLPPEALAQGERYCSGACANRR